MTPPQQHHRLLHNNEHVTIMNGEFVMTWKADITTYVKTVSRQFPGETEENHGNRQSG